MDQQQFVLWTIAIVSGITAYYAYQYSTFLSALLVLVSVTWLLYSLRSKTAAWSALSSLKKPVATPATFFMLGFIYAVFKQYSFQNSILFGLGTAFLGGALGMLLYKYWNIGG